MINPELGKRIVIIGPSSSGKSALATKIAKRYGLPCCYLDIFAHLPNTNWVRRDNQEFLQLHNDFIQNNDSWVVEGNYFLCMEERFKKADTIIYLKFNPIKCAFYYLKRCIFDRKNRYGKLQGAKGEFSLSLLKYILFGYSKKILKYTDLIENYKSEKYYIEIKNRKELKEFYKKIHINY